MKFHIEITRDTAGVSTKVIYRTIVDEISPERAKTKAGALLNLYAGRGANSARVLTRTPNAHVASKLQPRIWGADFGKQAINAGRCRLRQVGDTSLVYFMLQAGLGYLKRTSAAVSNSELEPNRRINWGIGDEAPFRTDGLCFRGAVEPWPPAGTTTRTLGSRPESGQLSRP